MEESSLIETIRANLRRELEVDGRAHKTLSRAAGLNEQAVRDLLGSVEDPKISSLLKLADALNVPPGNLFANLVPVVGAVDGEGAVRFLEGDNDPQFAPQPPVAFRSVIAVRVDCDDLRPAHRAGDLVYITREHHLVEPSFLDEECIVRLLDGRTFLKTLTRGSKEGCFTLLGIDGDPDVPEVRVDWAAPVLFTMRSWQRRNGSKKPDFEQRQPR